MPHLAIFLLGSLRVQLDAQPVVGLDALKARALLAYLVTEAAHPQRREVLAARLWPDSPDDLARRSLSVVPIPMLCLLATVYRIYAGGAAGCVSVGSAGTKQLPTLPSGQTTRHH